MQKAKPSIIITARTPVELILCKNKMHIRFCNIIKLKKCIANKYIFSSLKPSEKIVISAKRKHEADKESIAETKNVF